MPNKYGREDIIVQTRLAHPAWTSGQIATYAGCCRSVVIRALKRANLRLATSNHDSTKLQDHERQSVADLYAEGVKCIAIAVEYGVTVQTVRNIGRRAGHPPRVDPNIFQRRCDHPTVARDYGAGIPVWQIARKYNIDPRTVRRVARVAGHPPRKIKGVSHAA